MYLIRKPNKKKILMKYIISKNKKEASSGSSLYENRTRSKFKPAVSEAPRELEF